MVGRKKRKADETAKDKDDSSDDEILSTIKSNDKRKSGRKSVATDRKTKGRNSSTVDKDSGSEEDAEESEPKKAPEKTDKAAKKTDKTTSAKKSKAAEETDKTKISKKSKDESNDQYEVEEIIDHKIEDKTKYLLVRWKGFDSSADSWINVHALRCHALLMKYYEKHPEASTAAVKRKRRPAEQPKRKKKKDKKGFYPKKLKIDEQADYDSENDKNTEWKVHRILDVRYHRDKKRDFLIRWQDYSSNSDSWEPEENLNCGDLIKKFLAKLETIVEVTPKELRPVRAPTKHFVLMTQTSERHLSKRHEGRQRAVYYDCDE